MQLISYRQTSNLSVSIALGYFDCLHRGHRRLLETAARCCTNGAIPAMFTFDNEPSALLCPTVKSIYSFSTRCALAHECGIEATVYADFDRRLCDLSASEFLTDLCETVHVDTVVCGEDYTYGAHGAGTLSTLRAECAERGIRLEVVPDVTYDGDKVSSTRIRRLLSEGNIIDADRLLVSPYRMTGVVRHGRGDGHTFDTPTANFLPDTKLLCPKFGVYGTQVNLDGSVYKAVTNLGIKPTFDDREVTVETCILGYNGNLYGREITVEFVKRLRDIEKFESKDALYRQIEKDREWRL